MKRRDSTIVAAPGLLLWTAAQPQTPPSPPAQPATAAASAPKDCANSAARHDQGVERDVPTAKSRPAHCPPERAAAASAPRHGQPGHDDGKMHKGM
ncbi:MAG: hypothetical protein C0505_11370 [Leptothrix sp. (in: Bacteria)]|nr:hypothetical protein [Leptothrix sp. (in: b-proteobacteria)]